MAAHAPATPHPLRAFLRARLSHERLRRISSADYDRDGEAIAEEFRRNLDTGQSGYTGGGNPYECALMQRHDSTPDRPLNELFGAWWLGAFCSGPEHFVLIDNLAPRGIESLLHMVVRGCAELQHDAAKAAHAAIPFVRFLRARTPSPNRGACDTALAALEAIERLGPAAARTERCQSFMTRIDHYDDTA